MLIKAIDCELHVYDYVNFFINFFSCVFILFFFEMNMIIKTLLEI